jgi:SAM-dependent methyltransferase
VLALSRRGCTPASRKRGETVAVRTVACRRCGHMFVNPRMDDTELRAYYEDSFNGEWSRATPADPEWKIEVDVDEQAGRAKIAMLRRHMSLAGKRVLHVRCKAGIFFEQLQAEGATAEGLAVEEHGEKHASVRFGVPVARTELHDFTWPVTGTFDVIVLHHVLEHVTEPSRILAEAVARLSPGGYLLVEEQDKLTNNMRARRGRPSDHLFSVHLHNFTFEGLQRYLEGRGLRVADADPGTATGRGKYVLVLVQPTGRPPRYVKIQSPWSLAAGFAAWHAAAFVRDRLRRSSRPGAAAKNTATAGER